MTTSLQDQRVMRSLAAAISAVEPAALVRGFLGATELPPHSRTFLLGLGKAATGMTRGAAAALGHYDAALVITKHNDGTPAARTTVLEAGHPVPDQRSMAAGQAALQFVSRLGPDDLLICLISGGGSALAVAPVEGVSLADIQALTSSALASGAAIEEINNLRRCLDRLKGGGVAAATRAQVLGVILSDVIGDRLEAIASGPTVPSLPDHQRALALLEELPVAAPPAIRRFLGVSGSQPERHPASRITNVIIGNARSAADGALLQARRDGIAARIIEAPFTGDAQLVGRQFGTLLARESLDTLRPACWIAVGESTVALPERHGLGGRNQELALAAALPIDGLESCLLVALATDGEDGPTNAAGAVVTGSTVARARAIGLDPLDFLARHDSHPFFEALGDLLKPGYTGTNVNDIALLLAL